MRKGSKLAALLAITFATSFCTGCVDKSGDLGLSANGTSQGPSAIELEREANAKYKEKIAKWTEYVSYVESEDVKELKKTYIDGYTTNTDEKSLIVVGNGLYSKTNTLVHSIEVPIEETPAPIDEGVEEETEEVKTETVKIATSYAYSIYNPELNTIVFEDTGLVLEYDTEGKPLGVEYNKGQEKTLTINLEFANGIFEVVTNSYKENVSQPEEEGAEPVTTYEAVTTYAYYDKAGNVIAKDLEEKASIRSATGYDLIDIDEDTYALADGNIIKKFPLGQEINIPVYINATTVNGMTSAGDQVVYNSYGYITKGDYSYCVTEAQFEQVQISADLAMYRIPSVTFEVLNKDYDIVAKYQTTGYSVLGYTILENGNIYVCEYDMLPGDAQTYDFATGDIKFDVTHKVLDVATGIVSSLDKNYVVQRIFNDTTADLKTFSNAMTMTEISGNAKMKEGYHLAQIQKFENGELAQDTTTVVLNANLEVVAELPSVVENQFGYIGFLERDVVLLKTRTLEDTVVHYTGDVRTGDLELYFRTTGSSFKKLDGGFIYNKKVYSYDLKELANLSEYTTVRINKNLVYLERNDVWYVGEIKLANTSSYDSWFDIRQIGTGYSVTAGDYYHKERNNIYDAYGNEIFSGEYTYETVEEPNDSSKYVEYEINVNYEITEISEGIYLVTQVKTYVKDNIYGYEEGEEITNDKSLNVYYEYYVLK